MRTILNQNIDAQKKISLETLEIFAPLAGRISMFTIKNELEDIAFSVMNSEQRTKIISNVEKQYSVKQMKLIDSIALNLNQLLINYNIQSKIFGRKKTPYSIWKKMQTKNLSFDQIEDIIGFRIIVNTIEDCYRVLFVLHNKYHFIHGSFTDYISTPKDNGYKSLHTSIIGVEKTKMEIQIRTQSMHEEAQYGLSTHWCYKEGKSKDFASNKYKWLPRILEILHHTTDHADLINEMKLEIYTEKVFVFTKDGDLITLPNGATVIDFAFAVHSKLGIHCSGAKVNNQIVEIYNKINNGDQIEIFTSSQMTLSISWLKHVKTGKAIATIKKLAKD